MSPARQVVLLHGCGGSAQDTWHATGWHTALSEAGLQVHAPHLPGHGPGLVSRHPEDYADLAGLLDTVLPTGTLDVVGFSLGAKLALELAVRTPGRFRRIVLGGLGDNAFAPERIAPAAAQALETGATAETPPPVLDFLREWDPAQNDALAIAAVLRRPANPQHTPERLRQVTTPTLLVNGTHDPVGAQSAALEGALPSVRVVRVPGVDHFGLPRSATFRAQSLQFLTTEKPLA
jgi:pimeloyl-ACP methyl ester carboxylesterase